MKTKKLLAILLTMVMVIGLCPFTSFAGSLQIYDNGSDSLVYVGGIYDLKVMTTGAKGRVTYTWQVKTDGVGWHTIANYMDDWDQYGFISADPENHLMDHLTMTTDWFGDNGIDKDSDFDLLKYRAIAVDEKGNKATSQTYHMYIYSVDSLKSRVQKEKPFEIASTIPSETSITKEAGQTTIFDIKYKEMPEWLTDSEVWIQHYFEVNDGTNTTKTKNATGKYYLTKDKAGKYTVTYYGELYCGENRIATTPKKTFEVTYTQKGKPYIVNIGALNVRESPDSSSGRLGGVTMGEEVTVVETQGEWSKIVYGTGYGWVMSKYLVSADETNPRYNVGMTYGIADPVKALEGQYVVISYTGPNSIALQENTEFDYWEVVSGGAKLQDPYSSVTSFKMPASTVVIKGHYKEKEDSQLVPTGPTDPDNNIVPDELENPFVDVYPSDEYYDAVLWAYYHEPQITNGIDATHFGPNNYVKRCESVTFLWRAMGCPEPSSYNNPFVDVTSSDYYYKPVLWAVEKGITKGTDDTHFTPEQTLSTAHMITFLYRTKNPGKDGWYQEAANWAGNGYGGKPFGVNTVVNDTTKCPRGYVVMFLQKAI